MKKLFAIMAVAMLVAAVAGAQMPAEKRQELNAAGISNWTGPTKGAGPVFSGLNRGYAAPGRTGEGASAGTATVQYDNGTLNALPTVFGAIYGNRFDRGIGNDPITGALTLNSFSFYFMEDDLADTGLFFQPADPAGASMITGRASVNVGGLLNSGQSFSNPQLNVIAQSALGTTGVFSSTMFLGGWCLNAQTTLPVDNETIGLNDTAQFGEGGTPAFHGYTASSGTGPQSMVPQSFNAILRANLTGNVIPVELMAFDVD